MRLRALFSYTALLALFALLAAVPKSLHAQSPPSSSDTTFVSLLQGTELGVGALVQVDGNAYEDDTPTSFNMRVARLRLRGTTQSLRFFVQTDFTRSPTILDARLRVPLNDAVSVAAGLYKAPFSAEFLLFRGDLLFLERSRVVNALAPQRQTGVTVRADILSSHLRLEGGIFNGNGGLRTNDNDSFLYVGRLTGRLPFQTGAVEIGLNAAASNDQEVALDPVASSFRGQRVLFGLDARLQHEKWLLAAEWITASLDPQNGSSYQPWGYYATAGYRFAQQHQVLLRLDAFSDGRASTQEEERLLVGYNLLWSPVMKLQVNYAAPLDAFGDGAVGARLQLALN